MAFNHNKILDLFVYESIWRVVKCLLHQQIQWKVSFVYPGVIMDSLNVPHTETLKNVFIFFV